jgi:hypothetical protein
VANLSLVLQALRGSVATALQSAFPSGNSSGLGGLIFKEFPISTEIAKSVASNPLQCMVSVWPLSGARNETRYPVERKLLALPTPGTTATIDSTGTILTIAGTPATGDVVHAFFHTPLLDAAHRVAAGESAAAIATAIAAAANAYGVSGVTATPSGAQVTLSGAVWSQVNVGASGTMLMEITRVERLFDVTVWSSTSETRFAVGEAILAVLGGTNQTTLLCSDGTRANIWYGNDKLDDDPSESYSLYKWHLLFRIEYGITQEVAITQVEGVEWTQQLDSQTPTTSYAGGSS